MTTDGTENNVVPLALARLERLIETRLAENYIFGNTDVPTVQVRLEDARQATEDGDVPAIPAAPEFYDAVVDRILDSIDRHVGEHPRGREHDSAPDWWRDDATVSEPEPPCDYFVARLRCLECGNVSPDDRSSRCETLVSSHPQDRALGVGAHVTYDPQAVPENYYVRLETPDDGEPLHVLEGWECPECRLPNWAEVVIRGGVIHSIWSVEPTRDVLDRAHAVTSDCVEFVARISGMPPYELLERDILDFLTDEL